MNKVYKVTRRKGGVFGLPYGSEVTADLEPANERALVAGGHVKVVGSWKQACPACEEQGRKRPPRFSSHLELAEHYADKHPALAVPEGEEE